MKKKRSIGKKLCYSTIAVFSLFAVCGNLHAAKNDAPTYMQGAEAGVAAPSITLVAADELTGTWIIDQVKIKKTVNGVSSENTYSLKQKQQFESFTDCPKRITFTANGKIILEYDSKDPDESSYKVEGNRITRMTPVANFNYEYTLTDVNKIQLVSSIDYAYNRGNNASIDKITEEYTFFGTKQ